MLVIIRGLLCLHITVAIFNEYFNKNMSVPPLMICELMITAWDAGIMISNAASSVSFANTAAEFSC